MKLKWKEKHPYWWNVLIATSFLSFCFIGQFFLEFLAFGFESALDKINVLLGWALLMACILIPIALGAVYCAEGETDEE